jgi:hypothetical protein
MIRFDRGGSKALPTGFLPGARQIRNIGSLIGLERASIHDIIINTSGTMRAYRSFILAAKVASCTSILTSS